jgi:predicted transcriptional regulator
LIVSVDLFVEFRMTSHRKPTEAELEVLRVIWERGPSTVRQIHDALERTRARGYTTILKTVQIMTDKGLVLRSESGRTHLYRARLTERQTQRQLVRDLVDRAFGGSAARLMLQVLGVAEASDQELAEVQGLLDGLRKRRGAN